MEMLAMSIVFHLNRPEYSGGVTISVSRASLPLKWVRISFAGSAFLYSAEFVFIIFALFFTWTEKSWQMSIVSHLNRSRAQFNHLNAKFGRQFGMHFYRQNAKSARLEGRFNKLSIWAIQRRTHLVLPPPPFRGPYSKQEHLNMQREKIFCKLIWPFAHLN